MMMAPVSSGAPAHLYACHAKLMSLISEQPHLADKACQAFDGLIQGLSMKDCPKVAALASAGTEAGARRNVVVYRTHAVGVGKASEAASGSSGPSGKKVDGMLDTVMERKALGGAMIKAQGTLALAARSHWEEDMEADPLAHFKEGFRRFKEDIFNTNSSHFASLAITQTPKVMVISCCDSRVDPTLLMGAGPGDVFMVRSIANLVPPYERLGPGKHGTSAAIEYAVVHLKVEHIVVMGHQYCGGVKALMTRENMSEVRNAFIDDWMEIAAPACERTRASMKGRSMADQCSFCEREVVNVGLANCLTFPWVKEAVSAKKLQVHGWYYNMNEGEMSTWRLRYQITDYEKLD